MGIGIGIRIPRRPLAAWTPRLLSGLKLWCRSDQGVTAPAGVTQWDDQSGSGHHAVQPDAGLRWTYHASGGVNNRPYMELNGATVMHVPHVASLTLTAATCVVIVARDNVPGNQKVFCKGASTVAFNYGMSRIYSPAKVSTPHHGGEPGGVLWPYTGKTDIAISCQRATDATTRFNGSETAIPGAQTLFANTQPLHLGALYTGVFGAGGYSEFLRGKLYELILFDRFLTTAECEKLETYKVALYGSV